MVLDSGMNYRCFFFKCTQILNMHRQNEIAVCGDGACPVSTNNRGKTCRDAPWHVSTEKNIVESLKNGARPVTTF